MAKKITKKRKIVYIVLGSLLILIIALYGSHRMPLSRPFTPRSKTPSTSTALTKVIRKIPNSQKPIKENKNKNI